MSNVRVTRTIRASPRPGKYGPTVQDVRKRPELRAAQRRVTGKGDRTRPLSAKTSRSAARRRARARRQPRARDGSAAASPPANGPPPPFGGHRDTTPPGNYVGRGHIYNQSTGFKTPQGAHMADDGDAPTPPN